MTKEEQKQHVINRIRERKIALLRDNTFVECMACGRDHNTCDLGEIDYYVLENNATLIAYSCPDKYDETQVSIAYDIVPPPKVKKAIWA